MLIIHFETILILMSVAIVLRLVSDYVRLPHAALLIIGGAVLAFTPGLPIFSLDPQLILVLFLPPLLFGSAYLTSWRSFRADLRIIVQLAVGAVLFTTLIVGWAAHFAVPGLPWAACFALGAVVSPPDAVAAKAVLHGLPIPKRTVRLLEGESLVNDATGLVLYRFAVAAAMTGTFNGVSAAATFCVLAIGGVGFGAIFGLLASSLIGRIGEAELGITLGLLTSWGVYIGAEQLDVSGVLATVACGIIIGWRQHTLVHAATRVQTRAVWNTVTFALESLIFILIGLSLKAVVPQLYYTHGAVSGFLLQSGIVLAAVILSRFAWIVPTVYLIRAIFPGLRKRDPYPPLGIPILLSWAGMRGVVSLAAALALPNGFPGRDFILLATFTIILATVILQGSTLGPLIKLLRIADRPGLGGPHMSELEARLLMTTAELEAVKKHSALPDGTERHPRLVEQYAFRINAIRETGASNGARNFVREDHFAAILEGVAAGRRELLRLYRAGTIDDATLHILEAELDSSQILAENRRGPTSKR